MDVGNLKVPVTADLGPLEQELNRLKKLLGDFDNGVAKIPGRLEPVNNQVSKMTSLLGPLAASLATVFSIQQLVNFTNTWTDLSSRVNLAAGSIEKGSAVMDRLGEIADRTYSSLTTTTEAYIRNANTLRELGKSTQETLDYTEALNNALVVSGAKAEVAERVQNALGKAMAAGRLRGDELNTVIESGGRVAQVLAEQLGTTVSGLRGVGAQGKITGDVIYTALTKRMEQLRTEAEEMPATIGDAFLRIGNALLRTVGVFDQANNISGTFAASLIWVAENMQRLLSYVIAGTSAWVGYRVAILAVNSGLFTAVGAITAVRVALRALLVSTGFGALVVVVGEFINVLLEARDASESWGEAFAKVSQRIEILIDAVKLSFEAAAEYIEGVWYSSMASILESTTSSVNSILNLVGAFGPVGQAMALGIRAALTQVDSTLEQLERRGETMKELAKQTATVAGLQFSNAFAGFGKGEGPDLSGDGGVNRVKPEPEKTKKTAAEREAERQRKAYADLVKDSQLYVQQQQLEQQAVGMTELAAAKLRAEFDILAKAQQANIKLTPEQTEELKKLAAQMAEAEYATKQLQERYDFAKDTFKGFFTDLKTELQNGASIWEAFGNAAANALQKIADKLLDMALNGIFDLLFNAIGGGLGNFLMPNIFAYADGTSYAPGGTAIVGERGPELVRLPGGAQVVPNNRVSVMSSPTFGGNGGMGGEQRVAVEIFVKDDGKIGAIARKEAGDLVEVSIKDYDARQLPESVHRVNNFQRMR